MEKVLIIDDSIFNVKMLKDLLDKEYKIIYATNGSDGFEIAKVQQPSLILLDIEMPGQNGFQIMEKLQEDNETQQIPVVFLTGVNDTISEEKAFFCGAVDYIRKPYYGNVVRARVRTHVNMYRYRRMLETQMYIDVITGLYTRVHCIGYMDKLWQSCIQEKNPFSLGVVDIDYFKRVNDTYGHQEGDRVLGIVAEIMKATMPKENNYIARMGGEEFFILLHGEKSAKAAEIMTTVCSAVGHRNILQDDKKNYINVTISIGGGTVIPSSRDSLKSFIVLADKMLYKAKNNGRNQVVWM
ncbi:diguanylate cyclase [Anaerotignum sp.]|uniref:GGDEF domain-containing response regulator n=1 Tax=Anaerotignum sp. TaxID=2039241 RepID=UPI00331FC3D2